MLLRFVALMCFAGFGLKLVGIAINLAARNYRGVGLDVVVAIVLGGFGLFFWRLHRRLLD